MKDKQLFKETLLFNWLNKNIINLDLIINSNNIGIFYTLVTEYQIFICYISKVFLVSTILEMLI